MRTQTHPTCTGTQQTKLQVGRINDSESLRITSPLMWIVVSNRMVEMRYNMEKKGVRVHKKIVSWFMVVVKWDV